MNVAEIFLILIILVPLSLVAASKLRLDVAGIITSLGVGCAQYCGLGLLGPAGDRDAALRALAGLAEPVTVTLFSLFIVTRCLDRTGVTRWIARRVIAIGQSSESRIIGLLTATAAFLSLFMNNLAAGALVLPSAMEVARRSGIKPSKLLIPVAYGSCLGGAATYFTTSNIIASDMLRAADPPQAPLNILDFTPTGGLIAITGIIFLWLFGSRFLPNREPSAEQQVARRSGSELEAAYELNARLWEVKLAPTSTFVGKQLLNAGIGERLGITVIAIIRGKQTVFAPTPFEKLQLGDHFLIVGREDRVHQLTAEGAEFERVDNSGNLSAKGAFFAEVVLIPQSRAEGHTLKELQFRSKYGMTAVALRRDGRSYRTDVADLKLKHGDAILAVGGSDDRLKLLQHSPDFLLLEADPRDRPVDWPKASLAIGITLTAIIASIAGFPVYLAMFAAAAVMVISGMIAIEDVYHTMEWQALLFIAGMYPLSFAIVKTGLAQQLGSLVVHSVAPFGKFGLVAGAYVFTALLSQIIAGQVTTLITAPILISAAITSHTNPQAVAVAAAIACSSSFITPLSHPVNMLMIGPGNYRFLDFVKAGWLLTIISFCMLLIGMKLFWTL